MTMQQDRWKQVEVILDTALTLKGEERTNYIIDACEKDKALLTEVYGILEAIEESQKTNFLEGVLPDNKLFFEEVSSSHDSYLGMKIGAYKLTEQLGSGGMGMVYKAERADGQFAQDVAIKLLQKGIQSQETLRRFRMEQEILASLKHPNIAQLYDGGITDDGLSYLIMEYIDGVPIDQYCNDHTLTVNERIELFVDVCAAVQFAHTNLVIHRDLKASNIYVDSKGNVKVLDFGIAKLLEPKFTDQTLLETRPGQRFWTPQYAAPEQVKGHTITTATDVYALGVLLHKLLTDAYPLDLKDKSLGEVERIVTDSDASAASKSVGQSKIKEKIAHLRKTTDNKLKKYLSGDLDAVILKALRKEPQRRYQSVEQFSKDLDLFLKGYPVRARPETMTYRAKKFVRRNKLLVFTSTALLLVSITAAILSTNFALKKQEAEARAQAEAEEARRQTAVANSVNTFLQDIISQADPMTNPQGTKLTLVEAVELAADKVEKSFTGQPDVESAVRLALGTVDMNLGRLENAVKQMDKSLTLATDFYGRDHRQIFSSRANLGLALIKLGKLDSAKSVLETDLDIVRSTSKENWDVASKIDNQLGLLYLNKGNGASAEPHLRLAAKRKAEIYGNEHTERLTTLHNLSGALWMQGNKEEALQIGKEVLEIRRKYYGASHPKLAQSLNAVSYFYIQTEQYEKALPLKQEDLEMRESLYDKDHPDLARGMHNLAHLLNVMDRSEEAVAIQKKAVAMWKRTLPIEHPDVQRGHIVLSKIYQSVGQYEEAVSSLKKYFSELPNGINTEIILITNLLTEIANAQLAAGSIEDAESSYKHLVSKLESNKDNNLQKFLAAKSKLGEIKMQQGKLREAESYILESATTITNIEDADPKIAYQIVQRAIDYCEATNQDEKVTFWRDYLSNSSKQD